MPSFPYFPFLPFLESHLLSPCPCVKGSQSSTPCQKHSSCVRTFDSSDCCLTHTFLSASAHFALKLHFPAQEDEKEEFFQKPFIVSPSAGLAVWRYFHFSYQLKGSMGLAARTLQVTCSSAWKVFNSGVSQHCRRPQFQTAVKTAPPGMKHLDDDSDFNYISRLPKFLPWRLFRAHH